MKPAYIRILGMPHESGIHNRHHEARSDRGDHS